MEMKSTTYDILKKIVTIILPAIQTLWLTLGQIWNFPYLEQVGATIAAITVFIGAIIGVSNSKYVKAEAAEEIANSEDIGGESHVEKPDEEV